MIWSYRYIRLIIWMVRLNFYLLESILELLIIFYTKEYMLKWRHIFRYTTSILELIIPIDSIRWYRAIDISSLSFWIIRLNFYLLDLILELLISFETKTYISIWRHIFPYTTLILEQIISIYFIRWDGSIDTPNSLFELLD